MLRSDTSRVLVFTSSPHHFARLHDLWAFGYVALFPPHRKHVGHSSRMRRRRLLGGRYIKILTNIGISQITIFKCRGQIQSKLWYNSITFSRSFHPLRNELQSLVLFAVFNASEVSISSAFQVHDHEVVKWRRIENHDFTTGAHDQKGYPNAFHESWSGEHQLTTCIRTQHNRLHFTTSWSWT